MSRMNRATRFKIEKRSARKASQLSTKNLILENTLTDEEMLELAGMYDDWTPDTAYAVNDLVVYHGVIYKVVQAHTSLEGWRPSELPALYTRTVAEGVVPEWTPPLGAHDAYNTGDKVVFNGEVYESTMDGNVWSPADYPQGWQLYVEGGGGTIAEWVQPAGAHDAYQIGDKVLHTAQVWVSIAADNVWEPGVYGWELDVS